MFKENTVAKRLIKERCNVQMTNQECFNSLMYAIKHHITSIDALNGMTGGGKRIPAANDVTNFFEILFFYATTSGLILLYNIEILEKWLHDLQQREKEI